VTGASIASTCKYNTARLRGTEGIGLLYNGTLKNSGSTDTHSAYWYARVEGYGYT
jgi:hypothetical protein